MNLLSEDNEEAEKHLLLLNFTQTTQLILPHSDENGLTSALLSEPRNLFALQKEIGPQQVPRWPAECQVVRPSPQLLAKCPKQREKYYVSNGTEPEPEPWGEEILGNGGELVYDYSPESPAPYFTRSVSANGIILRQQETNYPPTSSKTLVFESRFESGNLARAIKITDYFYELQLRPDFYTARHLQWFFFSVTNMEVQKTYRFSITNFGKADSLYCEGMKPLMHSAKEADLYGIGWKRCGINIAYYRNELNKDGPSPSYTLSFTTEFPHVEDTVYFAYSFPYTYTNLQNYLLELQNDPVRSQFCKIRLLCRSLAGNSVHLLTVTGPTTDDDHKKGIILTARVHAGETPSSWIMKGVIDFLTGDSPEAKYLRDNFVFKIVPMLNPDGVIVGNTRCSLAARDLNRQYRVVNRECYPTIWHVKMLVRRFMDERPVVFYCDFHSHSRKHNVFLYGCENKEDGGYQLLEQIFPLMMHKASSGKFDFENCKFVVQRAKEGTGRVVMKQLGIVHSYTLEASVCGILRSSSTANIQTHFTIEDYEEMGQTFCKTLRHFFDKSPNRLRWIERALCFLEQAGSSADCPVLVNVGDESSSEDETSVSSHRSRRGSNSQRYSLFSGASGRKTDFLQVAKCISRLNVRMTRLTCSHSSKSLTPSPSRSPSSNVSFSPSPSASNRTQVRDPRKVLSRSLTLPDPEAETVPEKPEEKHSLRQKSAARKIKVKIPKEATNGNTGAKPKNGAAISSEASNDTVKRVSKKSPTKQKAEPVELKNKSAADQNAVVEKKVKHRSKSRRSAAKPKTENALHKVETYSRVLNAMKK